MKEKPYRIVDDGSKYCQRVKVFNPEGEEISEQVRCYTIRRMVGEGPTVTLEVKAGLNAEKTDMVWKEMSGPVVAEINLFETYEANG